MEGSSAVHDLTMGLWPIVCLACPECSAHPRGFVESSAGLMTPGACLKVTCQSSFQSCVAKNWMSTWRNLLAGLLALIISMADLSSLHVGVGSCLGNSKFGKCRSNALDILCRRDSCNDLGLC